MARTCGRHHGVGYRRQMVADASVEQRPITRRTMKTTYSPAKVLTAVTAMMLAGSLVGCDAAANAFEIIGPAPEVAADAPAPAGNAANALVQLESIPVKGRAPKTGYTRDEFGPAWADVDRNGCDTRNDILARDMTNETFKPGTNDCVVMTGTLTDKYTGTTITFTRGQATSSDVQIDHIVPLSDAWQKGAQQLNADRRKELANDPLNLMAADGPTNGTKGDKDAATWLPPKKAFRCEYVARQTAVKAKYRLWVTQAEHDAIVSILEGCKKSLLALAVCMIPRPAATPVHRYMGAEGACRQWRVPPRCPVAGVHVAGGVPILRSVGCPRTGPQNRSPGLRSRSLESKDDHRSQSTSA